jgi:hypothetical protein
VSSLASSDATSFIPLWVPFISPSCLIALSRPSSTCQVEVDICVYSWSWGKDLPFTPKRDISCGIYKNRSPICWIPWLSSLSSFLENGMWTLEKYLKFLKSETLYSTLRFILKWIINYSQTEERILGWKSFFPWNFEINPLFLVSNIAEEKSNTVRKPDCLIVTISFSGSL